MNNLRVNNPLSRLRWSCAISFLFAAHTSAFAVAGEATSDEKRRLLHQNRLDDYAPLTDATVPATHNSYHAQNDGYGGILNHVASRKEQLAAGIQFLNYDVRFRVDGHLGLCHSMCAGEADRLEEALDELYDHLVLNENKVVFLWYELIDDIALRDELNRVMTSHRIKEFLFKPWHVNPAWAATDTCRQLPLSTLSEDDIKRAVGARTNSALVVFNWHKDQKEEACPSFVEEHTRNSVIWNWAFGAYKEEPVNNRGGDVWQMIAENRGFGSVSQGQTLDAGEITFQYQQKGAQVIGLDHIVYQQEGGSRFHRMIWSWAPNEPAIPGDSRRSCVVAQFDGGDNPLGWRTASCTQRAHAVCQKIDSTMDSLQLPYSWALTRNAVTVDEAQAACQNDLGPGYHFAAPLNPEQAYLLEQTVPLERAMLALSNNQPYDLLINVRQDHAFASENGEPRFTVRVGLSQNSARPTRLLDAYLQDTLLQEVDRLHAAVDAAWELPTDTEAEIARLEAEWDRLTRLIEDCSASRQVYAYGEDGYCYTSIELELLNDRQDVLDQLNALSSVDPLVERLGANTAFASKRAEYQQSRVVEPPVEPTLHLALHNRGTYIATCDLTYSLNGSGGTARRRLAGGERKSFNIPANAVDVRLDIDFALSKRDTSLSWETPRQAWTNNNKNITLTGVWPGRPGAREED